MFDVASSDAMFSPVQTNGSPLELDPYGPQHLPTNCRISTLSIYQFVDYYLCY